MDKVEGAAKSIDSEAQSTMAQADQEIHHSNGQALVDDDKDLTGELTNGVLSSESANGLVENFSELDCLKGIIDATTNDIPKALETSESIEKFVDDMHSQQQPKSKARPSLVNDSKLVKISLPSNPLNVIQSNAQLLNKSRNFISFITEKSTNIMEKTQLLPHQLSVRQNFRAKESPTHSEAEVSPVHSSREATTTNPSEISVKFDKIEREIAEVGSKLNGLDQVKFSVCPPKASEELDPQINSDSETRAESNEEDIVASAKKDLLSHPDYLKLLKEYVSAKEENQKFSEQFQQMQEKCQQADNLRQTVERISAEIQAAKVQTENMSRDYVAANKERESMVMKYAVGEKQLIDTQRARDNAEKKVKELYKEQESLHSKLRQTLNDKTRVCNILDSKCREITDLRQENEKLKEELNVKDAKLKWSQNKLKTEMDAQKETQQKLDKAMARINEMREECEQVRMSTQETMRKFQMSEENKAVTLDQQLKEQQARLILERHVTEDKEMSRQQLLKEVEVLKNRVQALIEENNTLSLKLQDSETSSLSYESSFNSIKGIADQRQKEIIDLTAKVSELETLKLQLKQNEQNLSACELEMERLRQSNKDLQMDMDACRQREAQMLEFTQKLTDKNVRLQSDFTVIEARVEQMELEHTPLRERIKELALKVKNLEESLSSEKAKRIEECEILARHVAEQTQLAENLAKKLEDSQGENAVLKRKQQISLKEMTKELQQCRKRLETYEAASPSNSLGPTSRTDSNASLNTGDTANGAISDNSNSDHAVMPLEPDRQTLIERLLKLQKVNAKRAEKLDFLEEHTRTLVEELQKKTKIIQNYIFHENIDAMGSNERDRHKHLKSKRNPAELARHGGIMASVYNQRVSDSNMTLELSLEINQKLQQVLEDALLKNITLKDNIDTLGEEIARLTMQNQQIHRQATK